MAVKATDFVVLTVLLAVTGQLTWDTVGAGAGLLRQRPNLSGKQLSHLEPAFTQAQFLQEPVLLHCSTPLGKGSKGRRKVEPGIKRMPMR